MEDNHEISEKEKQLQYNKINIKFKELTQSEHNRDRRNILKIIARQSQRDQLLSLDTAGQIGSSIVHPFTKITSNDSSTSEKTVALSKKAAEKSIQGTVFIAKKGAESAQYLVKHSIKQPLMTTYRLPMSVVNGIEYLTLQGQILTEEDPAKKDELQKDANTKFKNLGYEGEKFIRAAAATAGIALVDTATLSSFGVSSPILAGTHAVASKVILATAETVDKLQNLKDGLDVLEEGVDKINQHKQEFHKVIRQRRNNPLDHDAIGDFRESLRGKNLIDERPHKQDLGESKHMDESTSIRMVLSSHSREPHFESRIDELSYVSSSSKSNSKVYPETVTPPPSKAGSFSSEIIESSTIATISKENSKVQPEVASPSTPMKQTFYQRVSNFKSILKKNDTTTQYNRTFSISKKKVTPIIDI